MSITKLITLLIIAVQLVLAYVFFFLLADNDKSVNLADNDKSVNGEDYLKTIVLLSVTPEEASNACNCKIEVIGGLKVSLTYPFKPRDIEDLSRLNSAGACGIMVYGYQKLLRNNRVYVQGVGFKSDECEALRKWSSIFINHIGNTL